MRLCCNRKTTIPPAGCNLVTLDNVLGSFLFIHLTLSLSSPKERGYDKVMIEFLPQREIAVQVGSFSIYWYGVLYVVAMVQAWVLLPLLQKYRGINWTREEWLNVVTVVMAGAVIGGRVGYVVFYEAVPVWAVRDGGMSAHGGFIGAAVALWLVARWKKISLWQLADVAVVPAAIGLALGRVGNFINQELFLPGAVWLAVGKDLFLALLGFWQLRHVRHPGHVTALFLIGYGVLRFIVEYFRVPTHSLWWGFTRGQLLSVVLSVVGVFVLARRKRALPPPAD